TLARHSIYVTGMCLRADPVKSTIEYASGGHPPAFLRAVDGSINNLDSTAFVLGACKDEDFDPGQTTIPFGPGDSLIAYTDGATEARTETGQMLRIGGMRRLLAAPGRVEPGRWPERLLNAVADHRDGHPPEDDTLVVEIYRSLVKPTTESKPARAKHEPQPAGF
ncbi:MAG: serine/threonine-protein phosphatase, partial [Phycisphaerales bacterium]|nr:serine/threonine-protein phosphatase [Phycisphaerales bacterium]